MPAPIAERLRTACAGPLPELLPADPPASLTHGDLWFGNVVDGRWVVDPAVCFADRELDLAFMETGGLPDELFDAYQREWPFEPGYPQRRPALAAAQDAGRTAAFRCGAAAADRRRYSTTTAGDGQRS